MPDPTFAPDPWTPGPGVPRLGVAVRTAKLLPPAEALGTLARSDLERRLAEGTERRLDVVVAGGRVRQVDAGRTRSPPVTRAAWYTLDAADRHRTLGHGI